MAKTHRSNYRPLLVIISIIFLATVALQMRSHSSEIMYMMSHFMGLFFLIFSMFKLVNLKQFVKGFRMYDILAKRYSTYGYFYPIIELLLGLAFLADILPLLTNIVTLIMMIISTVGVFGGIRGGMNLKCACLGTVLDVPLSTVSIIENIGMGIMAVLMIVAIING